MCGQWPRLPIHIVFPTHEVMGTLRPVDSYVADLITALRKAFKVPQNITQTEALRQKWRYDQKALTVTLNKGDVVLMRNDQFVGKRKQKTTGVMRYTPCATKSMWMSPCTSSKISEVKGKPFTKIESS